MLTELNEAPEGMYYIKVSVRDAKKAINIIDDQPQLRKAVQFSGSDTYYLTDEELAYDLKMDLAAHDVEIIDTNISDEDDNYDTDYVKRRKKEDDYYEDPDYYKESKISLAESLLDDVKEEEEPEPEEEGDQEAPKETVLEDATDQILAKFPTLQSIIIKLQTEDFKQFVDSIDWISPRPTSFRVNLKNGQNYVLKWTGKGFEAQILGKRYFLKKISEYQQALDKLAVLYKEAPMKGAGEETDGEFSDSADTGGGGDFPGDDAAGGGDDIEGDDLGGDDQGGDEGGEDLSDEPIDFEAGEEG